MKSAATPPPRRSTRNSKHAPSSPDQGKAPPPSARATRNSKKMQTETAPSTPNIAPSPSGNLAFLSPPPFPIPEATASNTPIATAVAGTISTAFGAFDLPGKPTVSSPGKGGLRSAASNTSSVAARAGTAPIVMPTASALLMTEQAPSASADGVSHFAVNASAIASADSTVLTMPEGDFHHGAAILDQVSQVNGCF